MLNFSALSNWLTITPILSHSEGFHRLDWRVGNFCATFNLTAFSLGSVFGSFDIKCSAPFFSDTNFVFVWHLALECAGVLCFVIWWLQVSSQCLLYGRKFFSHCVIFSTFTCQFTNPANCTISNFEFSTPNYSKSAPDFVKVDKVSSKRFFWTKYSFFSCRNWTCTKKIQSRKMQQICCWMQRKSLIIANNAFFDPNWIYLKWIFLFRRQHFSLQDAPKNWVSKLISATSSQVLSISLTILQFCLTFR